MSGRADRILLGELAFSPRLEFELMSLREVASRRVCDFARLTPIGLRA